MRVRGEGAAHGYRGPVCASHPEGGGNPKGLDRGGAATPALQSTSMTSVRPLLVPFC